MTRNENLIREVDEIRQSPLFLRSPSLTNVLNYLLARERSKRGAPTQFDIAVEAMGKNESFDEQSDSGVRVQISRLRKALENYYLTQKPADGLYIYIRVGEYRLRTANLEIAYPNLATHLDIGNSEQGGNEPPRPSKEHTESEQLIETNGKNPRLPARLSFSKIGVAAGAVVAAFVLLPWQAPYPAEARAENSYPISVPTIYPDLQVTALGNDEQRDSNLIERVGLDVQSVLQKSMISRLADVPTDGSRHYTLTIDIRLRSDAKYSALLALADPAGMVVAERSILPTESRYQIIDTIHDEVTTLVSPVGHIARDIASELDSDPSNSFECFLIVENSRSKGVTNNSILEKCITDFSGQEFTPYLISRKLFVETQEKMLSGEAVEPSDPEWRRLSALLQTDPENPYANSLAAKLLIGYGKCDQSAAFREDALSRGRTYPSLELAVIVDAFACTNAAEQRDLWSERIKRIALANPDPNALLESYIILGAIMSGQEWLLKEQKSPLFAQNLKAELSDFNSALRKAVSDHATTNELELIEQTLPALIYSDKGRMLIQSHLSGQNNKKQNQFQSRTGL